MVHTDYGRSKFHIRRFYARYVEYIQTVALFISAKYTRYMVVFVIRRNSMGGVFHHLLGALPLFFWTFFCLEEENAITYVVVFMGIGGVTALFPLFWGGRKKKGRRIGCGGGGVSSLGGWRSGGEMDYTQITGGVLSSLFPFFSKEVERWGDRRFLRIPISL